MRFEKIKRVEFGWLKTRAGAGNTRLGVSMGQMHTPARESDALTNIAGDICHKSNRVMVASTCNRFGIGVAAGIAMGWHQVQRVPGVMVVFPDLEPARFAAVPAP
jgi:hypothetical protein